LEEDDIAFVPTNFNTPEAAAKPTVQQIVSIPCAVAPKKEKKPQEKKETRPKEHQKGEPAFVLS